MTVFENKRILLTGGGTGIGQALIGAGAGHGNRWLICGRNEGPLRETADMFENVEVVQGDVSKAADRAAILAAARERMGGLDMLINNAGVQFYPKFDQGADETEVATEIAVNLEAPINLCSEAIPLLRESAAPMIVNISSTLALAPKASAPIYCATKAGLASFSRALRYQLKDLGFRVVTVYPPLVATPMTAGRVRGAMKPQKFATDVLRQIECGKDEVLVGQTKTLAAIMRIAPGLGYRIVQRA